MLESLNILEEAISKYKSSKTLADVDTLLGTYDYPFLRLAEQGNYRIEIWDKISAINGIEASKILGDMKCISEVYMIFVKDKLMFFQTHDPEQMGFVGMSIESANAIANKIVADLIEREIDGKVHDKILRSLLIE